MAATAVRKPGSAQNPQNSKNKLKMRKAGAKIKNFLIAVFVLVLVTIIFLFFTNQYFFKIKNINISENGKYSYEEILKASGISMGEELYGIDVKKAKTNIKEMLTYAESVNITRLPPSTVNIEIKTEQGFYGIILGGDYYIVSEKFRVIDKIKIISNGVAESDFESPEGVITLETDAIKKCYLGEKIEFSDEDIFNFLKDIIAFFKNNKDNAGSISEINNIDIINKFNVVMNYGDRFLVRFGLFENIESKILNTFEIINELPDYAEGIIDMTEEKTASFRYDENVAKLYKSNKNRRG
ncbi:MAG: FtsQ-type POTRA domain-containing protein [Oscillospiraceae bacterium]|nr:FtsQ-type POTRA domain-containing protein [Oscillospiraceae bacterium]